MKKGGHLMLYNAQPKDISKSKYKHIIEGGSEEVSILLTPRKSGKSGNSVRLIKNMFEISFYTHAFKHLDTFDEWEKNIPIVNKSLNILYNTLDISNTSQVENLNSYFSSLIIKILENLKLTFNDFTNYITDKYGNKFIIKNGVKIIFSKFMSAINTQSSGFNTSRTHSFHLISILKVNAYDVPVYNIQLKPRGDIQIYPSSYQSAAASTRHTSPAPAPASASASPPAPAPAPASYDTLFPLLRLGETKKNGGKLRSNIKKTRKKSRKTKTHKKSRKTKTHKKPRKTKTHKKSRKRI